MKSKPDSADKAARALFERFDCFSEAFHGMARDATIGELAILFRAAEKRGFKRAVKLLREETNAEWKEHCAGRLADWLEEQERK